LFLLLSFLAGTTATLLAAFVALSLARAKVSPKPWE
jgi:hypothetical protein